MVKRVNCWLNLPIGGGDLPERGTLCRTAKIDKSRKGEAAGRGHTWETRHPFLGVMMGLFLTRERLITGVSSYGWGLLCFRTIAFKGKMT